MNLINEIIKETEEYRYNPVTIVPGLLFDQWQTVNTIFFYYNSKYQTGDTDDEGDRKYFYNVTKNPCDICEKSIDFDTKSIRLLTTGGGEPTKTWFMERDFRYWMRDKQFGKTLNRLFHELPIFGSVVLKVIEGVPYFVDLRNFMMDKSADSLDSSDRIIESHYMTVQEFRKKAKIMKWPQARVDETIEKFHTMKSSHIIVYERYGEVETDDGKTKTYPWKRTFIADVGEDKYMQTQTGQILISHRGVELSSEDWDGHPYWEFHLRKIPGRWLGFGIVETLFEPQIRMNEMSNLQAKASYWAALRVFQTRDMTINRNLSTDVRNGEIVSADAEIMPIDMADRNLAFFNEEHAKWTKNIDQLTLAFSPIGKSVVAVQIALDQVVSYFEQIQEGVALQVKEMIYEDIMPYFEKSNTTEHNLRLVGKDLDAYVDMIKNQLVFEEVMRLAITKGKFSSQHDADVIEIAIGEAIKSGKEHILTIPKSYYKDVKYDIDIDITGESIDTKARAATKMAILQAITADPTMTTDPTKRKFLASYMEDEDLNPSDFLGTEEKSPDQLVQGQAGGRAGGGVSAPVPGMSAGANRMTQTV